MASAEPPPLTERAIVVRAAALLIGDELLSGKVADANLHPLARCLWSLGIRLCRSAIVGDNVDEIANELDALMATHDLVITSGGVGPTHDDRTLEAVSKATGRTLSTHPRLVAQIQDAYGEQTTAAHLRMAQVPDGTRLMYGANSRWPALVVEHVWVLPGVPAIFNQKLDILRTAVRGPGQFYTQRTHSTFDEGHLKEALDATVAAFPNVAVGSYPQWDAGELRTLVTFDSSDPDRVAEARCHFEAQLSPEALLHDDALIPESGRET